MTKLQRNWNASVLNGIVKKSACRHADRTCVLDIVRETGRNTSKDGQAIPLSTSKVGRTTPLAASYVRQTGSIDSLALYRTWRAGFPGSFPASALSPLREARSFFSSSVLACSKRDRLSNRACSCKALEEAIRVILISQRWKEVWKREWRKCKKSWTSNPAQCKHGWTNNPARCKLRQKNWIRSEPLGEATLRKPETNLETPPSPRPIERKTIY